MLEERPLRILITNMWLLGRSGTESVVRDLALGFLRRGHSPIVYAPTVGPTADELKARGVPVVVDLDRVGEAPEIIHGHHNIPTVEALVRFANCPAIWFCHDATAWHDKAPLFKRIDRYVAVDHRCRDRLLQDGVSAERITVLYNAVDLERIPPRPEPLPDRPKRAVAFTKTAAQVPVLDEACERARLTFTAFGRGLGNETAEPERELIQYDVVFATARSAIEALCAGAAVVVCDGRGLAELVTTENYERLRALNFGARSLTREVTVDAIVAEIERYDRDDALAVVERTRADADLRLHLDKLEGLYREAIVTHMNDTLSSAADHRALLQFMHEWLPQAPDDRWPWQKERQGLVELCEDLDRKCADLRRQCAEVQSQRARSLRLARAIRKLLSLSQRRGSTKYPSGS